GERDVVRMGRPWHARMRRGCRVHRMERVGCARTGCGVWIELHLLEAIGDAGRHRAAFMRGQIIDNHLETVGVSCRSTASLSPGFIRNSVLRFGTMRLLLSGSAGLSALPDFVMNAKLTGSTPTLLRQSALFCRPVSASWLRLSIFSAAHQCLPSHELP